VPRRCPPEFRRKVLDLLKVHSDAEAREWISAVVVPEREGCRPKISRLSCLPIDPEYLADAVQREAGTRFEFV
jgi:hypothetical protein